MREGLSIVTFNMRVDNPMDGKNAFSKRKDNINTFLKERSPDILCCQELTPAMGSEIMPELSDYYFIGCGREADFSGEQCSIAYKSRMFRLVRAENFWLSETPAEEGSRYKYQSRHPRICTVLWLAFTSGKHKGKLMRVYNTHLDHQDEYARIKGISLILQHMEEARNRPELPTILTGDFNAYPGSEPLKIVEQTIRPRLIEITGKIAYTFHEYGRRQDKIDYIFADKLTAGHLKSVEICRGEKEDEGLYLSDHYPVEALFDV